MDDTMTVGFTVFGKPETAGSKRGFYRGGHVVISDANPNSRPWKALVSDAAVKCMTYTDPIGEDEPFVIPPLEGPLLLELTFWLARPKGHYGTKGVRVGAPVYPTVKPDVLKLARAVEDALTGICYSDDAQIVTEVLYKRYGTPPRVEVTIRPAGGIDYRNDAEGAANLHGAELQPALPIKRHV